MLGIDDLMMGGNTIPIYRYIRITFPSGGGSATGFSDIRFYVSGIAYPPPMTAANAPAPYVVSATSEFFNGAYSAWKAFDGDNNSDWAQNNSNSGYIDLDLGAGHGISPDTVTLRPRTTGETPPGPIDFYGSNNAVNYALLFSVASPSWTVGVTNSYSTGLIGAYV